MNTLLTGFPAEKLASFPAPDKSLWVQFREQYKNNIVPINSASDILNTVKTETSKTTELFSTDLWENVIPQQLVKQYYLLLVA